MIEFTKSLNNTRIANGAMTLMALMKLYSQVSRKKYSSFLMYIFIFVLGEWPCRVLVFCFPICIAVLVLQ